MGQFFDEIPEFLFPWVHQQKMFWVATAPLAPSGHVNVSPKGFDNTFHLVNEKQVWYEDMTGSGTETIAHLRQNGRITIMFCAFEGPPRILRLFGTGTVHEFGTPEYNAFIPLDKRQPGSRSVIVIDVHKVGTSCGYSIPFYTFRANRMRLHTGMARKELEDIQAESCTKTDSEPMHPEKGMKAYWVKNNQESIDGLPALQTAFKSTIIFDERVANRDWGTDDERVSSETKMRPHFTVLVDSKLILGFLFGVLASGVWASLVGNVARSKVW